MDRLQYFWYKDKCKYNINGPNSILNLVKYLNALNRILKFLNVIPVKTENIGIRHPSPTKVQRVSKIR